MRLPRGLLAHVTRAVVIRLRELTGYEALRRLVRLALVVQHQFRGGRNPSLPAGPRHTHLVRPGCPMEPRQIHLHMCGMSIFKLLPTRKVTSANGAASPGVLAGRIDPDPKRIDTVRSSQRFPAQHLLSGRQAHRSMDPCF